MSAKLCGECLLSHRSDVIDDFSPALREIFRECGVELRQLSVKTIELDIDGFLDLRK